MILYDVHASGLGIVAMITLAIKDSSRLFLAGSARTFTRKMEDSHGSGPISRPLTAVDLKSRAPCGRIRYWFDVHRRHCRLYIGGFVAAVGLPKARSTGIAHFLQPESGKWDPTGVISG
jgi:hypothetical protein